MVSKTRKMGDSEADATTCVELLGKGVARKRKHVKNGEVDLFWLK